MTLLSTVQRFCNRTGISSPTTVYGTTDPQITQILALLEEEGNDLSGRGDWEVLTNEATHTTVATESQGAISTIASNGFRYIKNNTIWDRSLKLPVYVISQSDWQAIKAFAVTGPRYHARIRGGNLIANPTPTAGNTWAFEYISWNWITDTNDANPAEYFTADTDKILLPEPIIMMGLRWRWKKEKGLDYEEDFNTYEGLVLDALGRDGMKGNLNMGQRMKEASPGIVTSQGNWDL